MLSLILPAFGDIIHGKTAFLEQNNWYEPLTAVQGHSSSVELGDAHFVGQ